MYRQGRRSLSADNKLRRRPFIEHLRYQAFHVLRPSRGTRRIVRLDGIVLHAVGAGIFYCATTAS